MQLEDYSTTVTALFDCEKIFELYPFAQKLIVKAVDASQTQEFKVTIQI